MIPGIPVILPMPFAQNGERRDIPDNNTTPGSADASWAVGFPPVTRINKQAGGKPPYGLDFQGIFHALSQHLFFAQSGNVYPWQGANGAFPGLDYLTGAHVLGSDGSEYVALMPSGPDVPNTEGGGFVGPVDPVTDAEAKGGYWSKVFNGGPNGGAVGGAGLRRGGIVPYCNVTFGGSDGRRAIFWGEEEADEAYILCDGGSDGFGGTVPDLRDRMILGASDTYPADTIGGSTEIDLAGLTVGATTLTVAQMPSHSHKVLRNERHRDCAYASATDMFFWLAYQTVESTATGQSLPHTHALSGTTASGSNLPPFYSLAFVVYVGEAA